MYVLDINSGWNGQLPALWTEDDKTKSFDSDWNCVSQDIRGCLLWCWWMGKSILSKEDHSHLLVETDNNSEAEKRWG